MGEEEPAIPLRTLALVPAFARRAVLGLGLAGLLLPMPLGSTAPARAEHTEDHQPVARRLVRQRSNSTMSGCHRAFANSKPRRTRKRRSPNPTRTTTS